MASSADAGFIAAIENDPELKRLVGHASGRSEAEYRAFLEAPSDLRLLVIESLATHDRIGLCGLLTGESCDDCEVRVIVRKDFWGNGIGTEVLTCLTALAAKAYPHKQLTAKIHPENVRSLALARRLGFVERGSVTSGTYIGWIQFGLTQDEPPI
jgi:RimJ/RimL family protein N-acetyltransferase